MSKRYTVTKAEMQAIKIGVVMAHTDSKRLMFTYDVGRKRMEYVVFTRNDESPGHAFDTLEVAIEAYNEG